MIAAKASRSLRPRLLIIPRRKSCASAQVNIVSSLEITHVQRCFDLAEGPACGSAIDGRTSRHPGYAVSQRIRKRIEEVFGWEKTVGNFRKTRFKGRQRTEAAALFLAAAFSRRLSSRTP